MAINRNNELSNRHILACGQSGCGKTTFVSQHPEVKSAKRILFWDPYGDYNVAKRFETLKELKRFISGNLRKGLGFKAALSVSDSFTPDEVCDAYIAFLDFVWQIADGNKDTVLVLEEIADAYDTVAKARGRGGQVFRAGRSFGLINICMTQSTAEIPKTVVKQCGTKAVFFHEEINDIKRAAVLAGVTPDEITALKVGEYYLKSPGEITGKLCRTKKLVKKRTTKKR